jgi:methyl coenzyme M reductase beta subunit
MDMVFILILMELSMKDIGKKINKMVQVKKVGPMVPLMKEIINKVKKVGKVNLNGLMEVLTMVNLKIII